MPFSLIQIEFYCQSRLRIESYPARLGTITCYTNSQAPAFMKSAAVSTTTQRTSSRPLRRNAKPINPSKRLYAMPIPIPPPRIINATSFSLKRSRYHDVVSRIRKGLSHRQPPAPAPGPGGQYPAPPQRKADFQSVDARTTICLID